MSIDGHPGNVTARVKGTIRRAHKAGLIVTATTDGAHSNSSWHYPMKGRNRKGCAVDLGFTAADLQRLTATERRNRLINFQLAEYRYAKRFRFATWLELIGPDNEYVLLNGQRTDLTPRSTLERAHEDHVHVGRRPIPKRPRRRIRRVSKRGVDMVATFEGFRSQAYRDPVGVATIGFGETNPTIIAKYRRTGISRAQALALLKARLNRDYASKVAALRLPLSQDQFDAVTSFVYNLGPGYLSSAHTIGVELRRHHWRAAADAFLLYDRAGGKQLPGLTRRREAERRLFLSGTK